MIFLKFYFTFLANSQLMFNLARIKIKSLRVSRKMKLKMYQLYTY